MQLHDAHVWRVLNLAVSGQAGKASASKAKDPTAAALSAKPRHLQYFRFVKGKLAPVKSKYDYVIRKGNRFVIEKSGARVASPAVNACVHETIRAIVCFTRSF